jgi:hypothetical protein
MTQAEFHARAWRAANIKARELGWIARQAEAQVIYSFLTPHLLSFSTQTPPAFSHSALFFASFNPAKAGAVRAVAAAKVMNAKRSLFM